MLNNQLEFNHYSLIGGAVIRPVQAKDAAAVAAIYNHYVMHSTATFELEAVCPKKMQAMIESNPVIYPWLVLEIDDKLLGYAKISRWKERPAYRHTVEISVYISADEQRKGYGKKLYIELLKQAKALGYHALLAGITLPNPASIKLHESLGFEQVAHFKQTGFKFNQWVDVGYWQCLL